ncbi:MAG: diguanylate cyclase [Bacilli bacterium]|nr:diguanylate cyclase [Bacilli bacterium]
MNEKKGLLIIEDNFKLHTQLKKTLDDAFRLFEFDNLDGVEATLNNPRNKIDLIIVNYYSNEKQGIPLMKILDKVGCENIPVIANIGEYSLEKEQEALAAGALSIISVPYKASTIKMRVENAMKLNDEHRSRKEKVKGHIYDNREDFYKAVHNLYRKDFKLAFFTSNIVGFKIYNDLYGSQRGDDLISFIGDHLLKFFNRTESAIMRINGDRFVVCAQYNENIPTEISDFLNVAVRKFNPEYNIVIKLGFYVVEDKTIPVEEIVDKANIALDKASEEKNTSFQQYEGGMQKAVQERYGLLKETKKAIADNQIVPYYQPIYSLYNDTVIGFEVLARWEHPTKGILLPDVFVPLLEKNGMIKMMDRYIWERCFKEYYEYVVLGGHNDYNLSFNLSCVEVFSDDLVDTINDLVKKYQVNPYNINFEIPEKAFILNPDGLKLAVDRLKNAGYDVVIDGFGSGYSSLSLLMDVPVSGIKVDMGFVQTENTKRDGYIFSFLMTLAKTHSWFLIGEKIETLEHTNFLKSIGCSNGQGRFLSDVLTIGEIRTLLKKSNKKGSKIENITPTDEVSLDVKDLWNPNSAFNVLFNQFISPILIMEYSNNLLTIIRANDSYYQNVHTSEESAKLLSQDMMSYIYPDDLPIAKRLLESMISGSGEDKDTVRFIHPVTKQITYIKGNFKCIYKSLDKILILASVNNITSEVELEEENKRKQEEIESAKNAGEKLAFNVVSTLQVMVARFTISDNPRYIFANNELLKFLGYTREEFFSKPRYVRDFVPPEGCEGLDRMNDPATAPKFGEEYEIKYQIRNKEGKLTWIKDRYRVITDRDYGLVFQSVFTDITDQLEAEEQIIKQAKNLENSNNFLTNLYGSVMCGIACFRPGEFKAFYINDYCAKAFGFENQEEYFKNSKTIAEFFFDDGLKEIGKIFKEIVKKKDYGKVYNFEMPVLQFTGSELYIIGTIRIIKDDKGEDMIQVVFIDFTSKKQTEEELLIEKERLNAALSMVDIDIAQMDYKTQQTIVINGEFDIAIRQKDNRQYISEIDYTRIDSDYQDALKEFMGEIIKAKVNSKELLFCYRNKKNVFKWSRIKYSIVRDRRGSALTAVIVQYDVTREIEAKMLFENEMKFKHLLTESYYAYLEYDVTDGKALFIRGDRFKKMVEPISSDINDVLAKIEDNVTDLQFDQPLTLDSILSLSSKTASSQELYIDCKMKGEKKGETIWVTLGFSLLQNPTDDHTMFYISVNDIDKRKKEELLMQEKASRDALTDLYNRHSLETMGMPLIRQCLSENESLAFIILDLDNFKGINDKHGHIKGDQVLKNLSKVLKISFKGSDIISRIGGDEFVILYEKCGSYDKIKKKCTSLLKNIQDTLSTKGMRVTASIGVCCLSYDVSSFGQLYNYADKALYQAKASGKNSFKIYDGPYDNE